MSVSGRVNRLPRLVSIGPYKIRVVLVSQRQLQDEMDDDDSLFNGCWLHEEGNEGTIMILETLPLKKKWETFWHELYHGVTDLAGWHSEQYQS